VRHPRPRLRRAYALRRRAQHNSRQTSERIVIGSFAAGGARSRPSNPWRASAGDLSRRGIDVDRTTRDAAELLRCSEFNGVLHGRIREIAAHNTAARLGPSSTRSRAGMSARPGGRCEPTSTAWSPPSDTLPGRPRKSNPGASAELRPPGRAPQLETRLPDTEYCTWVLRVAKKSSSFSPRIAA
jgi:hypothetical protein